MTEPEFEQWLFAHDYQEVYRWHPESIGMYDDRTWFTKEHNFSFWVCLAGTQHTTHMLRLRARARGGAGGPMYGMIFTTIEDLLAELVYAELTGELSNPVEYARRSV